MDVVDSVGFNSFLGFLFFVFYIIHIVILNLYINIVSLLHIFEDDVVNTLTPIALIGPVTMNVKMMTPSQSTKVK